MIAKLLQQWLHGCGEQAMHVIQELAKRLIEQSLRLGRQKATSLGMRPCWRGWGRRQYYCSDLDKVWLLTRHKVNT